MVARVAHEWAARGLKAHRVWRAAVFVAAARPPHGRHYWAWFAALVEVDVIDRRTLSNGGA